MAVRNRPLNSTMPFTRGPRKEHKEALASDSNLEHGTGGKTRGSEEDLLCTEIPPLICKVLMEGTAKCIGNGQLHVEKPSSFIAQAECEASQEFSPSSQERPYFGSPNCFTSRYSSEHNNVACKNCLTERPGGQPHRSPRKRRRQHRRRQKAKKRPRERQRRPLGVPEQESSSPLQLTQEKTPRCTGIISTTTNTIYSSSGGHTLGVQETEQPDWPVRDLPESPYRPLSALQWVSSSSTQPWGSTSHSALPGLSFCSQESSSLSDSAFDCTLALQGLRGSVSQEDRCFAPSFFKEVERDAGADRKITECDLNSNEGLLFQEVRKLQPNDYEYREGRDYSLLNSIQNGAYGDVYRVQDTSTGFECAAKKVPLDRFRGEEVGTWSALKSRRVVELFGAVREGLFVILFMALKSGSIGQLLKERGRLPEDLALHYHCQVLEAIEDLQRKQVLHLDVKADNVLLSEDGRDVYLCDFGHSERLDSKGRSTRVSGEVFPGTESHMAPEVAKGEALSSKADVWSSSCFLLHMLNGCPPWTRYYSHPLILTIAEKPPPLREIPRGCSPYTAEVIQAGLVKDPEKRASAQELREKVSKALKEVGGLTSPVCGAYQDPERAEPPDCTDPASRPVPSFLVASDPVSSSDESVKPVPLSLSSLREESCEDEEEEKGKKAERETSFPEVQATSQARSGIQKNKTVKDIFVVPEQELQKLERDFYLSSLSQPYSPELQERLLSCLSSDYSSQVEPADKDFGRCSFYSSDLSSGVFSYSSQEGPSFSVDWLGRAKPPTPHCLEGVDVCIQDFDGRWLKIRETNKIKIGHIATGISEQISERAFSLETQDGCLVSHDEEVSNVGLYLRCTHAFGRSGRWKWRVKDGVLDVRA
ncbi:hypothetical protein Z043-100459 [Arapaima gigas]